MSMLLFIIGGIAVMVGAATVAYGVPINEFSFGNTLIIAGTTLGAGGLIIIALAAAVRELHHIAARLEEGAGLPAGAPVGGYEAPPAGRVPFPPKTKPAESVPAEPGIPAPPAFAPPAAPPPIAAETAGEELAAEPAPGLPNPETPATVEEEAWLSPPPELGTPPPPAPPPPRRAESGISPPNFEEMWPARPSRPAAQPGPAPEPEAAPRVPAPPPADAETQPPAVAVLKSGVVDGMAYTLYVDGSIEAELPQGTVRFASIDELRAHLEKSS